MGGLTRVMSPDKSRGSTSSDDPMLFSQMYKVSAATASSDSAEAESAGTLQIARSTDGELVTQTVVRILRHEKLIHSLIGVTSCCLSYNKNAYGPGTVSIDQIVNLCILRCRMEN